MEHNLIVSKLINTAKKQLRTAEEDFSYCKNEIERLCRTSIDIDDINVYGQVLTRLQKAKNAADNLYNTCQSQIITIDDICRPLCNAGLSEKDLKDIRDMVRDLNISSKIDIGVDFSVNHGVKNDVGEINYSPTIQCLAIEQFWDARYSMSELYENVVRKSEDEIYESEPEENSIIVSFPNLKKSNISGTTEKNNKQTSHKADSPGREEMCDRPDPSSFDVTDDIDSLSVFINRYTNDLPNALKENFDKIIAEKPARICSGNDSRIKKIESSTEKIISDYAGKLQEIMLKLNQIGEKKLAEKAPDVEIKDISQLISDCYDILHIETTVKIYKGKKRFTHKIDVLYDNLAKKWNKACRSLPSVKLETIKKSLSSEKRRRTILGKNIEKAEKDVETVKKAYDDEAKAFEDRKAEYDTCVALLNSEVSDISDEIQQLEKDFSGAEEKKAASAKEFSEKISSNEKELNKLNEKLRTLMSEREMISGEEKLKREKAESAILFRKKKQQEYDEVSVRLAEKDKEVFACEKEKSDLDAQISQLKGEMKESNARYEDRLSQMRQKIRDLVASRAEKEYDIESLGKEMTDYEKNLSGKEAELKKAEYELAWQKREYDIADKKVTESEKKKESAESAVSKLDKKITKAKTSE